MTTGQVIRRLRAGRLDEERAADLLLRLGWAPRQVLVILERML